MDNQPIVIDNKIIARIVAIVLAAGIVIWLGSHLFKTVDAGHVGVAILFGKVVPQPYPEGLHIPVNPLYKWEVFDARQQTHLEKAGVPSQDQLTTMVELSVQFRINGTMAPIILKETGTAAQAIKVHLIPKVRSLLREQGKSIKRAEDFFLEETQQRLQNSMASGLQDFLTQKGIEVQHVLIREITLPARLVAQIEQKKEAEQMAERQKATLLQYKTKQDQLLVTAEAKLDAAKKEAEQRRILAEVRAFEIQQINDAIADNPAYIQLEALKALQEISKDPAAKLYFINSDSPMPLPLMHMGSIDKGPLPPG